MAGNILDMEPKRVWYYFNEICKRPHGSGNEAGLRDYIAGVAKSLGCEHLVDKKGNIIIRKPAQGSSSKNCVILQGHMDMVCEAEKGKKFDPAKDPIVPKVDGDWLKADGTSLGADNGIAIATALAILESKDLVHGPIECLFTVEEETGLFGATALEGGLLKGKTLINMDSEEENTLYVGCAGGRVNIYKLPLKRSSAPAGTVGLQISISDMTGGHSGLEINKQRGNSIKLLGRVIAEINAKFGATLEMIEGGSKHNVIPSSATAIIAVKKENRSAVEKIVHDFTPVFKNELSATDPNLKLEVKEAKLGNVLSQEDSNKILNLINSAPHGVQKMSADIPGLVQTSANCAKIRTTSDNCEFEVSVRSSVESEKEAGMLTFDSLVALAGGKLTSTNAYPAWQPNLKSHVLDICKKLYKDTYKEEPIVTAIHAGLECGVVSSKYPGMDAIAYGPQLHDVHSPNERLGIKSAQKFHKFIANALEILAKE